MRDEGSRRGNSDDHDDDDDNDDDDGDDDDNYDDDDVNDDDQHLHGGSRDEAEGFHPGLVENHNRICPRQ